MTTTTTTTIGDITRQKEKRAAKALYGITNRIKKENKKKKTRAAIANY